MVATVACHNACMAVVVFYPDHSASSSVAIMEIQYTDMAIVKIQKRNMVHASMALLRHLKCLWLV